MEDDFKTPEALAAMFSLVRLANSHLKHPDKEQLAKVTKALEEMVWIIGLEEKRKSADGKLSDISSLLSELGGKEPATAKEGLESLIKMREDARKGKDYARSDLIRSRLKEMGIILEDKPDGTRWKLA